MADTEDTETETETLIRLEGEETCDGNVNQTNIEHNETNGNNKRQSLFFTYCLMAICWGLIEPIGATIYVELQCQLNTTEQAIAFCFTTRSIASIISSIVTGRVVDRFIESHRYVVITSALFIISMIYLPYTQNIYLLHAVFAIIGFVYSVYFVVIFIYVLRIYSDCKRKDVGRKIYIILTMYGITKTIYPLLMQLSILNTNSYIYPLYAMLTLYIILILLLLTFKTPKHDKLRTIKAELTNNDDKEAKHILTILNQDKKNRICEGIIILILGFIMFCYSVSQEHFITFAVIYCDAVDIGEKYGRYLISTYFSGQLLYRVVNAVFVKCKDIKSSSQMFISFVALVSVSFAFLFFYDDIIWMFFVWFLSGFFASAIVPEIEIWTEIIKPVTGSIEILYKMTNAAGELVAVFGFGVLIQQYSVVILKYLIFIYSCTGFVFVSINIAIYSFYYKHKVHLIENETLEM